MQPFKVVIPDDRRQRSRRDLRAGRWALAAATLVMLMLRCAVAGEEGFPGAEWEHISPIADGWSAEGLAAARERSDTLNATAVMVIHHGAIVAEWGDTAKRTELASVRKSLLNALVGIAVGEKKISLDSTLAQLGIDDNAPSLTDVEKTATVRMLLQARSGVYHPALYETREMAEKRPVRGSHPPGAFWYYNNWDFNALGAIYERAAGVGIFDALDQQIAKPIGMQDYRPGDGEYVTGAASIHPAYPLRMSARDLARFALLYLRGGAWAGRRIVPAEWVRDSTQPYSRTGFGPGYGYLWWTGTAADPPPDGVKLPDQSFFALGAGGQYAFIVPTHDLVVVIRVDRDQHLPQPKLAAAAALLRLILQAGGFEP